MSQTGVTSAPLLERDTELAAVSRSIADVRLGAGRLVVIDGPAGVGKTAVMDAARSAAVDAGLLTVRARGAELEREFAFGVVRQLFDDVLRGPAVDRSALFDGAARFAAALLDVELEGVPPAPSDDPFAARHALYWLTANLAADRPVALLLDDAHWADAASLGVLAHIANRLEGIPVALVVASRMEESPPALDALRAQADAHGTVLRLAPLGEEAARIIVRSYAPEADDETCHACFRASGGNPFLLNELSRVVLTGEAGAIDPARVLDRSPERVTREVAARLARLPEQAARLARAAATLGEDAPLRQAAALADVDQADAAEAADALVAAGILRSAHPMEFLHPLLRAAVYAGLEPAARSREHARAARLLADETASPERVAAQLLRCQPAGDRWVYQRLMVAGRLVWARGAADAAATHLRRALEEPPPPEDRNQVLLELGSAEAMASDAEAAVAHLREALAGDIHSEQRFGAAMLVAGLLGHSWQVSEAVDLLERQLPLFADDPDLRHQAEVALTNVARIDPATRPRAAEIMTRLRKRVEDGDEHDPGVLGTVAAELGMAGVPADTVARVAERALEGFDATVTTAPEWSGWNAVRALVVAERYDAARHVFDRALAMAQERGAVLDLVAVFGFRGELNLRVGALSDAEVDARSLHEISTAYGWPKGEGFALALLGEVLLERGELADAAKVFEDGMFAGPPAALPPGFPATDVLFARGRVRLAQGRADEAVDDLRECGRRSEANGNVNPAVTPWRSQLVHALVDLGQTDEAERLAAEELELAREFGAPRAISIALRTSARVNGGYDGIRVLREAIDVLEGSPAELERAQVHAALGAAMRAAGNPTEAREPLRLAVDLAHRCGAHMLEGQTLEELRATGARPRRRATAGAAALTPSERRIAELAAGGQQNREIAQALFVTTHTVEFHLRNAYRKLGITSRTELAKALSTGAPAQVSA
jgi:DNA-binding CsgD family transcriptional regulator